MNKNFFLTVTALAIMFTVGYAAYTNGSIGDLGQVINDKISGITSVGSRFLAQSGASDTWIRCASEGERCSFSGTKEVRYGANGTYINSVYSNGVSCETSTFGSDPVPFVKKGCDYFGSGATSSTSGTSDSATQTSTWTDCATEGGICNIVGRERVRVRFGANESYLYYTTSGSSQMEAVVCRSDVFGSDPAPGVVKKCSKEVTTVTETPAQTVVSERPASLVGWIGETVVFGTPPTQTNVWTLCANEDKKCTLPYNGVVNETTATIPVKYGVTVGRGKKAKDAYVYKNFFNGDINCNDATFGSDPAPNAKKKCYYAGTPNKAGRASNIKVDVKTTKIDGVAVINKFKVTAQKNNADYIKSIKFGVSGKGVDIYSAVLRMFSDENMTQPVGNVLGYRGDGYSGGVYFGGSNTFPFLGIQPGSTVFFSLEANLNRAKERSNITSRVITIGR